MALKTPHNPSPPIPPPPPNRNPPGVPPKLAAMSLAYCVCLFGSLTHYASGQAAVYVGSGFLSLKEVFLGGAACAAAALLLWGTAGMAWWKVLGWW